LLESSFLVRIELRAKKREPYILGGILNPNSNISPNI